MALKAWFPLNGTFKNKGIENINMTSTGLSFNNNGKMGQCLQTTTQVELNIPQSIYDVHNVEDTEVSYSLWVKIDKDYLNTLISTTDFSTKTMIYNRILGFNGGTTSSGIVIQLITPDNLTNSTVLNQIQIAAGIRTNIVNNVGPYYTSASLQTFIDLDKWYHLAITFSKTNELKFYINGELIYTKTNITRTAVGTRKMGLNRPYCYLSSSQIENIYLLSLKEYFNDVRVYDHCLSPLEVKELSQGLMAHWTFTQQSIINGKVIDSSGFDNDLNMVNGTISNDTAAYSTSTNFTNGQYAISSRQAGDWLPKEQMTVNLWTKWSTWGTPISCTESGGWNFEQSSSSNGIQFPVYINTASTYKIAVSKTTYASLAGNWHMFTGVFDGTSVKIYIDGIEKTYQPVTFTKDTIRYNTNTPLVISGEAIANLTTPSNTDQVGNISDVRIYSTPLSDTSIKLLYNTVARIDNQNKIYCKEYIEQDNGNNNQAILTLTQNIITPTTLTNKEITVYPSGVQIYPQSPGYYPSSSGYWQQRGVPSITYAKPINQQVYTYQKINITSPMKYSILIPSFVCNSIYTYATYETRWEWYDMSGQGIYATDVTTNTEYYYAYQYKTSLKLYDINDTLLQTINLGSYSSSSQSAMYVNSQTKEIEFPYEYSNIASSINYIVLIIECTQMGNSGNSIIQYTTQGLNAPQPIKITRNGQFYNRIIDQNSWANTKVSFKRDGQIIAQDFIEY